MKTIEVSDEVFEFLNSNAVGFEMSTPDKVLKKLLNIKPKSSAPIIVFPLQTPKVILRSKGVDFWEGMQLRFKGRPNDTAFVRDGFIQYGGKKYRSPSAAAVDANSGTSTNGWIHWEYLDTKSGTWKLIDTLRTKN